MTQELSIQEEQQTTYNKFTDYMSNRGAEILSECAKQAINIELPINMLFFPAAIFAGNPEVQNHNFGEKSFADILAFLQSETFLDAAKASLGTATKISVMGAVGHLAACASREFSYDYIDSLELGEDATYYTKLSVRTSTGFLKYAIKYGNVKGGLDLALKVIEGGANQLGYFLQENSYDSVHIEIASGLVAPTLRTVYDLTQGKVTLPTLSDIGLNALVGASLPTLVKAHVAVSPLEDYAAGVLYNTTTSAVGMVYDLASVYIAGDTEEVKAEL